MKEAAEDIPVAKQKDVGSAAGTTSDAEAAKREPEYLNGRFQMLEKRGNGVHGCVFRAKDMVTENIVAVKKLKFSAESEEVDGIPTHIIREVVLLRDFEHPNIVRLLDVVLTGDKEINMIFEYVDTDLWDFLKGFAKKDEKLPTNTLTSFTRQMISGIYACHTRVILHRDLKPQNILIHQGTHLKICDFGLSRIATIPIQRPFSRDIVTMWYRAPEIFLGENIYGMQVDNWSMGCIIAEMVVGCPIFAGDSEIGSIMKIFKTMGTPNEETWPGVTKLPFWQPCLPKWPQKNQADIVGRRRPELPKAALELFEGLLTMSPARRLSSRKANFHRYFQEIDEA
eukprot:TRINITY_DN3103_c1_g1_i1.p2 TRINITY_DN3103_c1_g1~~TRINITY_DN3103_c1_g1_i1.p2  ORF type:complete len:340 (-),score=56.69 TRINITY_DN3103_c1_g1_i1:441-1460(-)